MQEFSRPYSSYVSSARLLQKYESLERDIHFLTGFTLTQLLRLFAAGYRLEPPKYNDSLSLSQITELLTEETGFVEV